MARCTAAFRTDEFHGWGCNVSGDSCMFLVPNSKACAEQFGEGPDADIPDGVEEDKNEGVKNI